jgi:hypothetical protein
MKTIINLALILIFLLLFFKCEKNEKIEVKSLHLNIAPVERPDSNTLKLLFRFYTEETYNHIYNLEANYSLRENNILIEFYEIADGGDCVSSRIHPDSINGHRCQIRSFVDLGNLMFGNYVIVIKLFDEISTGKMMINYDYVIVEIYDDIIKPDQKNVSIDF